MQFKLRKSKLIGCVASSYYYPPCYQKEKTDFPAPDAAEIKQTLANLISAVKDTILEYVKAQNAGK